MTYSLFHIHSHYSLLDGYGFPTDNVSRAKELGLNLIGLSDHGCTYGHYEHWQACKKNNIKCALGNELYVFHKPCYIKDETNRQNSHMVVWANNKKGWDQLNRITSHTNDPKYFWYKPRISLYNSLDASTGEMCYGLEHFCDGNISSLSGHQGSHLSDNLFCDLYGDHEKRKANIRKAYSQYKESDIEFYKQFLKPDWLDSTCKLALELERIFGKNRFFIELQNELDPNDIRPLWVQPLIVDCLRQVSKITGIMAMASSDPHYARKEDAEYQRLMVMVNMKTTEAAVNQQLTSEDENDVMVFFGSNNFFIHSYDEMAQKFSKEELDNTNYAASLVEQYNITRSPMIPSFDTGKFDFTDPSGLSKNDQDRYLMKLCIEGCKRLQPWLISGKPKEEYWNRLKSEFEVISKFGLSGYFLTVQDFCMAADNRPADHSFDWKGNLLKGGKTDPITRGCGRGCFLPNTKILLKNGTYKNIEDIQIGDEIITHLGNIKKVLETHKYECNEEVVNLNFGARTLSCTKDHRLFNGYDFQIADSYEKYIIKNHVSINKHFGSMPKMILTNQLKTVDLVHYCDLEQHNKTRKQCFFFWDDNHIYLKDGKCLKKTYKRHIDIDSDLGIILGFYLSEGWCRNCNVGFAFHSNEIEYRKKLSNAIYNVFGLKTKETDCSPKKCITIDVNDILFQKFCLKSCGKLAENKKIDEIFIDTNNNADFFKSLILSIFQGDGHKDYDYIIYSTASVDLIGQIKLILNYIGFFVDIHSFYKEGQFNENRIRIGGKQCEQWNNMFVSFKTEKTIFKNNTWFEATNDYFLQRLRSKSYSNYKGSVYDLTIEDDCSYIANDLAVHNSAAGCLISYLTNITGIDPITYNLSFSRFLNAGRMTKDNIELPDIDIDFEASGRDWAIKYVEDKYGKENVSPIITFQRIQGKAAVKDIFRVKSVSGGFELANYLSTFIPNESDISDELQQMRSSTDSEYGILQWALDNNEKMREFLEDEEINKALSCAIKCEGKKRGKGKHPSGFIISNEPIKDYVPMSYDPKSKEQIVGVDMNVISKFGFCKFDLLGVSVLDKLKMTQDLVNGTHKKRTLVLDEVNENNES